jgi:hypothetical protein
VCESDCPQERQARDPTFYTQTSSGHIEGELALAKLQFGSSGIRRVGVAHIRAPEARSHEALENGPKVACR